MPTLYNCKHSGNQFRITKFTSDFEVEASYLLDATTCECPAGHRPTCRHRQMLLKFIARNAVDTEWFWDHDRGGWIQGWKEEPKVKSLRELMTTDALAIEMLAKDITPSLASAALPIQPEPEPSLTILTEVRLPDDATPDQVAEAFGNLLAPEGLGQASDPQPLRFDKDYSNSIGRSPGNMALGPSPSPTIRRRV